MDDLKQKLREFKEGLFVAAPVIVKKIADPEIQLVDVQLKVKHKNDDPPWILDVPVSHNESTTFSERKLPEVGDVAWVVFTNRAIDKTLESDEITTPDHDRVLDINDCYLAGEWSVRENLGGVPEVIGDCEKEDWLMGFHRVENSTIYIRYDNGNIVIEPPDGDKTLELTEQPRYHAVLFEILKEIFDSHTHPTPKGPSGPPNEKLTEAAMSNRVGVDK